MYLDKGLGSTASFEMEMTAPFSLGLSNSILLGHQGVTWASSTETLPQDRRALVFPIPMCISTCSEIDSSDDLVLKARSTEDSRGEYIVYMYDLYM